MLQANFIMIYIIHKIMRILKRFSKRLLFYLKNNDFFSQYIMMESSRPEGNIIKNIGNVFSVEKLKKETNYATVKGARNLFKLEKENKAIRERIVRDIRNLFVKGYY